MKRYLNFLFHSQQAKYDARNQEKKKTLLPYTQTSWKQNQSLNGAGLWSNGVSKEKKLSSGNLLYNAADTKILMSV